MIENATRNFAIAIFLIAVLLGGWYFLTRNNTGVRLLSVDKNISWETEPLGGITKEDLLQKIKELEKNITTTDDLGDKYFALIALGQDYRYLGDGAQAFTYLNKAINTIPKKSTAYLTMGSLLSELGATTSARLSYETGLSKEPQFAQNHLQLINFYLMTDGISDEEIDVAFNEGLSRTGSDENILKEYASWLETKGKIAEAITVWEKILLYKPSNSLSIRNKINFLKQQQ